MDERIGHDFQGTEEQKKRLIHLLKHGTSRQVAEECVKQLFGVDDE